MMNKYITDERTGLKYELVGDYYLIAGDDEPEEDQPIGIWGQRHLRYLKEHHRVRYANLLTSGELNAYLVDIDRQAEELFLRLVKQKMPVHGLIVTPVVSLPQDSVMVLVASGSPIDFCTGSSASTPMPALVPAQTLMW